jgi:hypothetical protein
MRGFSKKGTIEMAATISPAPIRKSFVVRADPTKAFQVFAHRMHDWSPAVQTLTGSRKDIVIEPKPKGRWYEVGEGGKEADWGHVIEWQPPHRMLLAWQLDANYSYNPDFVTEVEVRFTAEGAGTRVDFEHRNLERFGEVGPEFFAGLDGSGGWSGSIAQYVALLEEGKA